MLSRSRSRTIVDRSRRVPDPNGAAANNVDALRFSRAAAEDLSHIFDLYRQADEANTRSRAGLGIGLALVRQLVQLHGGTVSVASAGLGQGSEFTVHLPREDVAAGDRFPS